MSTVALPKSLRFERMNPFREPNWRWEHAGQIIRDGKHVSRHREEEITIEAVRFRREHENGSEDHALGRHPAIAQALKISQNDGPHRWEIEARLLAGETDHEIAQSCKLSPETVGAFESLFFHVRDRLEAHDYICRLIGPGLRRGFQSDEVRSLWLAFGYFMGGVILDELVQAFQRGSKSGERPSIDHYFERDSKTPLTLKAAIALENLPHTPETAAEIFRLHSRLIAAERSGSTSLLLTAKAEMLRTILEMRTSPPDAIRVNRSAEP